jgi:glycerol-3-phosphate acyltransferase PlsY
MLTSFLIAAAVGYLLGAVPFGYLVARAKGVNIFEVGSRNPGATNVRRVLGTGPGNLVFALDALKGALSAAWPLFKIGTTSADGKLSSLSLSFALGESGPTHVAVVGLVGALLGHSFSCFTGFRGGKGVATATGGFVVLLPIAVSIGAVLWALTFYTSRYVSLASIVAAVTVPTAAFLLHEDAVLSAVATLIGLIVIVRHRANVQRLLNGTESKFVKKPAPPTP